MEIKVKHLGSLFLSLLMFESGCATQALWTNDNLEACKEPAPKVNLRLFQSERRKDLLVVYDEYSERSDRIHTRAYLLDQNLNRLNEKRAPHFVNPDSANNLISVPVFNSKPEKLNPTLYAVATNQTSFTIYSANREISSHDLPVYNDGKGRVEKLALTPIFVTADITVVGGFVGYWVLLGIASSGGR